jgi:hypothetical protein
LSPTVKDVRGLVIYANQVDTAEKSLKSFLALLRRAGVENALLELGERDERYGNALCTEILNARDDL